MSQARITANPPFLAEGVAPFLTAAVGDVTRPRGRVPRPAQDLQHLPGEGGLLVGMRTVVGRVRSGAEYFVTLERRFGKVFRSQLALFPVVYVCDPEMIAQILRNEDRAWSSTLAYGISFEGSDGGSGEALHSLATLDFEAHRDARKILQPAFGAAATASYLDAASPLFEQAIESWVRRGKVDFKREIRTLLARIATRTFLGVEDDREASMIEQATSDLWGSLLVPVKNRWVSRTLRKAIRARERLLAVLRPRVAERRARGGEDLFSRLCVETRGAKGLDDDSVIGLFLGILLAAFDTTANTLASMAYYLAKNPEWQERLRAEAEGVGLSRISYENVKRLEATDRAWKETLRLMPIAQGIPRYSLRDVSLGDSRIPAGAFVVAMTSTALRSDAWWTNPQRFDPDRFSEERAEDRKHKGLFLPFGSGAHACIGMHLATAEAKAFWHAMLTRCKFRLARDYEGRHTLAPLGVVSGNVSLAVERVG